MNTSFHKHIFDICLLQKRQSDDIHTQVGITIVDQNRVVREIASNTLPKGVIKCSERLERPEKYFWMEHAERNAFYHAARVGIALGGSNIYLLGLPCMDCARGIIQVGIVRVNVHYQAYQEWNTPKYQPDFLRVETMLKEAGVGLSYFDYEQDAWVNKSGEIISQAR